jgi:uncharacterized membrane protein YphA (DoxX/SURF4 family)
MARGQRLGPGLRYPSEWIAALRVGMGVYFAKAIWTKLALVRVARFLPVPVTSARWLTTMPRLVARQADGNPLLWYRAFLEQVVLPHATLFAHLTAWGEVVAGTLLTLGLFTRGGALVALWLVLNYGLATQWMSPSQLTLHVVLASLLVVFAATRAGDRWGLDAVRMR